MTTLQPLLVRMWASTQWPRYALTVALALCPWLLLLLSTPYGLDLTDESFYLLSYAYPTDITATFSMFHFVGKPLYDLSGGDIATMRALGIVLWLLIATATAWTTLGFVARRCGIEPFGRWERGWLALVPVAGGAIYYRLWLVTPSYNLFALMGLSLFWMGFLWWVEPRHVDERAWRRYVGTAVFGCAAAVVFWSKATSAMVLPLFPLAALLIERRRWRVLLSPPTLVWGGVGFVAGIGLPVFYGLSIPDILETLNRGIEYQRLMKPAEYGSLKITLAATYERIREAWEMLVEHRHYPFGDLFFVWLLPLVAAVIAGRWLRNGAWWAMDDHLSIRGGTQTIIVDEEMARYISTLQMAAAIGGFEPGTPFIDMTGRPGASYVLSGRPYDFPWLLGGYPGSNPAAAYILQQWEPRHLKDAWILTVAENGGRPLSLSILEGVGVVFPEGYMPVGAVRYPGSEEIQVLWKPKD